MVNGQWTAGYDTLNRLTSATLAGTPATTFSWTYDAFGNRTSSSPNGGATNYPLPINRSSAWQYDFSGRVIDDGGNQHTYDGEGRLCVAYNKTLVSYTGYAYDGLGNRVARGAVNGPGCNNSLTASQTFVVGINGELLDTLSASGAVSSNVQANGQLLATYQYGAGNWSYALNDWLGTKRVVANVDGTIQETCLGLPFGDGLNCTGTDASTLHFTGKERDTESGLDYFGARYFGSSMGRFMSPDWSSIPKPVPYADFTNPQTLNLYSYARNNPLSRRDEDGHADCGGESGHSWLYCLADALGFVETHTQQVQDARNFFTNNVVTQNGKPVDQSKLNDQQVLQAFNDFNAEYRKLAAMGVNPYAAMAAPIMTTWGWSNSPPYIKARNELEAAGDHPDLNGKVPTRDEANRMIQESGGTVNRNDPGHDPGGVSTHTEPHVNYTTASGQKATVSVREQ